MCISIDPDSVQFLHPMFAHYIGYMRRLIVSYVLYFCDAYVVGVFSVSSPLSWTLFVVSLFLVHGSYHRFVPAWHSSCSADPSSWT